MTRRPQNLCMAASPLVSEEFEAHGWRGPRWWSYWRTFKRPSRHKSHDHLYIARLEEFTDDFVETLGRFGDGRSSFLVFVRDFPIEAVPERIAGLHVRDPSRIHISWSSTHDDERQVVERLVSAIELGALDDAIVDAWWEPESFVALSPRFKRLHVLRTRLLESIPALARLSENDLNEFEIHPDGAYVHWPKADVHLGWDQLHQMVDEGARVAAIRKRDEFGQKYGQAIRSLREARGVLQAAIPGMTDRHVRRIERGEQALTHKALEALARAHDMSVDEYLGELAERVEMI